MFRVRDAGNNAEEELLWLDGYAGYKVVSYTLKPDNFQCKFKSEPAGKPIKFKVTNDSGASSRVLSPEPLPMTDPTTGSCELSQATT